MRHEIETQWMGKMQFNSLVNGHTVIMDGPAKSGGEDLGPIPKPFVLTALSGCTGMDVIALMRKANKPAEELNIKITGEISNVHPIVYTAVHIIYEFKGIDDAKQNALEAVTLSQEKYCGVSHMLKKIMPVTWEIVYNGMVIFNNKIETVRLN